MVTKEKVSKREIKRWVKWLRKQGYNSPLVGLKPSFPWVKDLAKELRKDPPTILETRPRDPRTIASNLARYERKKGWSGPGEREAEAAHQYEEIPALRQAIDQSNILSEIQELVRLQIQGVPQYLYQLSQECYTPGLLICSREYLQNGMLTWIECLGPCDLRDVQMPTVCTAWERCLRGRPPTFQARKLFVGYDRDGVVWMRLPARFRYPDFERMFTALRDIALYKEICVFEKIGATYVNICEQLLPYLEHQHVGSTQRVPEEERDIHLAGQLPPDVVRPIHEVLDAWNQQASRIRAWGALIRPISHQN